MNRSRKLFPLRPLILISLISLLWGCLPGSGKAKFLDDETKDPDQSISFVEGTQIPKDSNTPGQDGSSSPSDGALTPDTTSSGGAPKPPYGNTVGKTANNFKDIPDCGGTLYELYSYYQKKKGVLVAMVTTLS